MCYTSFMSSPEALTQEPPLSAEQQEIWRALVKQKALRSLRDMEALYLSEEQREARRDAPLTNARYQEWLAWMKKVDADPKALFTQHMFVDEGALVENTKAFTQAMEALKELRANARISVATQERLGFPKIFQHVSPEKLALLSLTIGGKTPQQLEAELEMQGVKVEDVARFMMRSKDFATQSQKEELQLVRLTVGELFRDSQQHTTDELFFKAKELGLELCPAEVGPHLRLKIARQSMDDGFSVAMKQITAPDRGPSFFGVSEYDDDLWLSNCLTTIGWFPEDKLVFRLPAVGWANNRKTS